MEDDDLVSHFNIETDTFLEPPTKDAADRRRAHLVIAAYDRPHYATMFNLNVSQLPVRETGNRPLR